MKARRINLGFQLEPISVPIGNILSSRKLPNGLSTSRKYRQIASSIKEIGLIEPLSVTEIAGQPDNFMLLDGHMRLMALRDIGEAFALCLIANDDESYTYNNQLNRLSTVQEHFMIQRAIARGVSQKRLAAALDVKEALILKKVSLLNGICEEAVELLKDRRFSLEISSILRKMKPARQIECVELMVSANNVTVPYASAMLVATPVELLVEGKKSKKLNGISPDQVTKMEREMSSLQGQYKMVEQTYGRDILDLVLARGYLLRLIDNPAVARYLKQNVTDVLTEFQTIIKTVTLER